MQYHTFILRKVSYFVFCRYESFCAFDLISLISNYLWYYFNYIYSCGLYTCTTSNNPHKLGWIKWQQNRQGVGSIFNDNEKLLHKNDLWLV